MGPTSPTAVAVNLLQVRTVIADLTAILWHGNTGLPYDVFRSTTTLQVLGSILSICLGILLGSTWTIQIVQVKLRKNASERRKLNQEWLAIREVQAAMHKRYPRTNCAHCGYPWDGYDCTMGKWASGTTILCKTSSKRVSRTGLSRPRRRRKTVLFTAP